METAKKAQISFQGLQALETGADPRISTLSRVATALGVSVVDLLDTDRFRTSVAAAAEDCQDG
jgi:DNA-binding phage protein